VIRVQVREKHRFDVRGLEAHQRENFCGAIAGVEDEEAAACYNRSARTGAGAVRQRRTCAAETRGQSVGKRADDVVAEPGARGCLEDAESDTVTRHIEAGAGEHQQDEDADEDAFHCAPQLDQ
jgi:hypothetical protein